MATVNPRNGYSFESTFVQSKNGTRFQVDAQYKDRFQGLINDLDARGYQFTQAGGAGGFADRRTASGGTSAHSSGLAIDINPLDNPNNASGRTNLPSDVGDIAAKNGLAWGGADKFGNPDAMHFEVPGAPGSSVKSVGQWNGPEDTAKLSAYNQKKGFSTPLDPNKPMSDGPPPSSKTNTDKQKGTGGGSDSPPPKQNQNDIQGTTGEYKKTQTKTISSIMPTHEPWPGHPNSNQPRQAVQGTNGSSGSADGSGTTTPGSGTNTGSTAGDIGKSSGAPATGKTADRITQAYDRLVNVHGFTPEAAKAAVATTMGEALTVDYTKVRWDVNGPSAGIAQWHDVGTNGGGRYSKYKAYMDSKPGGAASLDNQIDYLAKDLKENYPSVFRAMQNGTAGQGVDVMVKKFEIPRNAAGESIKRQGNLGKIDATLQKRQAEVKRADPGAKDDGSKPSNQSTTGQQQAAKNDTQTPSDTSPKLPANTPSQTSTPDQNLTSSGGANQGRASVRVSLPSDTPGSGVSTGGFTTLN